MELFRNIFADLLAWKNKRDKKPLIIQGARQTGKTWCMQEFGKKHFKKTAYFNFEKDTALKKEFSLTKDPAALVPILELYCGFPINREDTLIVFDEIQECNEALNSLKYFSELSEPYHIICAGSLLGVALRKEGSFPVGRVEFLNLYPLTLGEFIRSADPELADYLDSLKKVTPLPVIIHEKLHSCYTRYQICGGIPRAVIAMLEENSVEKVDRELESLLLSYSLDFKKHASVSEVPKITAIWNSLPAQLAKENRKFVYGVVRPGARAREYESSLDWLQLAGLVYKIPDTNLPYLPLSAYDSPTVFKIYLFDVGILRALAKLSATTLITDNPVFREFKGAFAENTILQNLIPQYKVLPRYWTSEGRAEVDFILQGEEAVVPVEVKSSDNKSGKSLKVYIDKYTPALAVIFSSGNVQEREGVIDLPHGLVSWLSTMVKF